MLEAGEDARFIARRLVILASEDVGMADPHGAAWWPTPRPRPSSSSACPRRQLNLAQAVVHLATAPKSNRSAAALWRGPGATSRDGPAGEVPIHLRDARYQGGQARARRGLRLSSRRPAGLGAAGATGPPSCGAASTTSPRPTASSRRSHGAWQPRRTGGRRVTTTRDGAGGDR